jgi:hypothetical protein
MYETYIATVKSVVWKKLRGKVVVCHHNYSSYMNKIIQKWWLTKHGNTSVIINFSIRYSATRIVRWSDPCGQVWRDL